MSDREKIRTDDDDDLAHLFARAMQSSTAWPAVFKAGSAITLARACVDALRKRDGMTHR